jgi:hypothetical protein
MIIRENIDGGMELIPIFYEECESRNFLEYLESGETLQGSGEY